MTLPRWLLALAVFLATALAQQPDLLLRVLLLEAPSAQITLGSHQRITAGGRQAFPGGPVGLAQSGSEVLVDGQKVGPWVELAGDGFILGDKAYRGSLLVVAQNGRLLLINRVWLEDYLLGVLPAEVPRSFPAAALQAQAILARTFALSRLNPSGLYDLCADERCQVYGGRGVETPEHTAAVQATRTLIVSYANQPIAAVYHADSGGYTAAAEEVWGRSVPYLLPRPDPYSQSPKSPWALTLSPAAVAQRLLAQGAAVGEVLSLEVLSYTDSGRPSRVRVRGSLRAVELAGAEATRFLRGLGLPSTRISINGWQVSGRGLGHGVGMSQWGAKGFAQQGWDFRQILGYYYPGTFLSSFEVVSGLHDKLVAAGYPVGATVAQR
ncbi:MULTISPECIES: SpoIID/LytB domain-containing protein [unclassified Meiothermus]|uniref:SpoIID/LytB domain-containing protein n=1 Tax=unclassified Meiothermus TaxID=370471 RepID=UPI000D7C01FF|nr:MULTISPECIES: SpoIID/LytB domain-containing protein [unclassified Meiothermus]PZA06859.1 stage II sporulation protein SpoIID [Meiothermus sp. Pnk-1]RYM33181.1 SpoIID/LytB domain-containing protein [Meiothermus sp. PNK-Is4]